MPHTVSLSLVSFLYFHKTLSIKHRLFNIWSQKADIPAYNTHKVFRNTSKQQVRKASFECATKMFESLPDLKQQ